MVKYIADWIAQNGDEVAQSAAFTIALLPSEPAAMTETLSRAQSEYGRMGALLADAESFVLLAHAAATMEAWDKYAERSADERKIMAKADPDYLQALRLRDNLKHIVQALHQKAFACMSAAKVFHATGMNQ